jgi:hypothetical protein
MDRVEHDPSVQKRLKKWCTYYFGDISEGAPTQKFNKAVAQLMALWEQFHSASSKPLRKKI